MNDDHQKYFPSKYPILCAGMNTVSDIRLALAIREAGCYPSFVTFNHGVKIENRFVYRPAVLYKDLKEYVDRVGDSEFVLSVTTRVITECPYTKEVLHKIKPAYIELLDHDFVDNNKFINTVTALRANGTKILVKCLSYSEIENQFKDKPEIIGSIDGIIIKGDKAAGRVASSPVNLIDDIKKIKKLVPGWIVVAQGGIHDASGIKEHLLAGADAVSIGTMFALSEESSISSDAKNKMLNYSYTDTVKIGEANQVGIVFSKTDNDVENNTIGLRKGIASGASGHIFAGAGLDHVSQIRTVSKIVEDLVLGL